EVTCVRRAGVQHRALPCVRGIAPHAPLAPMQQQGQRLTVVDVGRSGYHRVNELALAIDAEVPSFRSTTAGPSWSGASPDRACPARSSSTTGRDNRGVHNGVRAHRQAVGAQMLPDGFEQGLPEPVLLEQMTELADRALVR